MSKTIGLVYDSGRNSFKIKKSNVESHSESVQHSDQHRISKHVSREKSTDAVRSQNSEKKKNALKESIRQYNGLLEKEMNNMKDVIRQCLEISKTFGRQQRIVTKTRMIERTLNAAIRLVSQNKPYDWMIDDGMLDDE